MIMMLQRRDGSTRPLTVQWWVAWLTAAALAGGLLTNALAAIGFLGHSPRAQFAALAHQDSVIADTAEAQSARLDQLTDEVAAVRELTVFLVAVRCLEPDSAKLLRMAQVPCARVLRERGVDP